jgi:Icc-related predicted phosphoesterase
MADIHGNRGIYERIPAIAREHRTDVVVLAGDLLGAEEGFTSIEDAQRADGTVVVELLERASLPVIYIMGNDDMVELAPARHNLHFIHGIRLEFGGFNFVGYQYSLPFMGGVYEKLEEEIAADLGGMRELVDSRTIFVTHSPAYGIRDHSEIAGESVGSRSIREFIDRCDPLVHIHGHIHAAFGQDGKSFNVASGGRILRGAVLDLKTGEHELFREQTIKS